MAQESSENRVDTHHYRGLGCQFEVHIAGPRVIARLHGWRHRDPRGAGFGTHIGPTVKVGEHSLEDERGEVPMKWKTVLTDKCFRANDGIACVKLRGKMESIEDQNP